MTAVTPRNAASSAEDDAAGDVDRPAWSPARGPCRRPVRRCRRGRRPSSDRSTGSRPSAECKSAGVGAAATASGRGGDDLARRRVDARSPRRRDDEDLDGDACAVARRTSAAPTHSTERRTVAPTSAAVARSATGAAAANAASSSGDASTADGSPAAAAVGLPRSAAAAVVAAAAAARVGGRPAPPRRRRGRARRRTVGLGGSPRPVGARRQHRSWRRRRRRRRRHRRRAVPRRRRRRRRRRPRRRPAGASQRARRLASSEPAGRPGARGRGDRRRRSELEGVERGGDGRLPAVPGRVRSTTRSASPHCPQPGDLGDRPPDRPRRAPARRRRPRRRGRRWRGGVGRRSWCRWCRGSGRWSVLDVPAVGPGSRVRSASWPRPRAMRDLTVPTGIVEHLGDLGVVEVGDVAQHDRGAELLGQVVERVVDGHPVDDGVDAGARRAGRRPRATGRRRRRRAAPAAGARRRSSSSAALVAMRYDPRRERRAAVEPGEAADDADHRLLGGVVGVAAGAGDAPAHRVDAVVVAAQQAVERVAVAGLGGGHQAWRRRSRRRGINRSGSHRSDAAVRVGARCSPGHGRARGARSAGGAPASCAVTLHGRRACRRPPSAASGGPQSAKPAGTASASAPNTSTWNGALPTSNDSVPVAGAASVMARPTPALPPSASGRSRRCASSSPSRRRRAAAGRGRRSPRRRRRGRRRRSRRSRPDPARRRRGCVAGDASCRSPLSPAASRPIVAHSTRATTSATASRPSTSDQRRAGARLQAACRAAAQSRAGVGRVVAASRRSTGFGGVASPGIGGAPGRVRGTCPVARGARMNGPTGLGPVLGPAAERREVRAAVRRRPAAARRAARRRSPDGGWGCGRAGGGRG